MAHTPGPWTAEGQKVFADRLGSDSYVAISYGPSPATIDDIGKIGEAKARLIAAAHELLAALQAVDTDGRDANPNGDVTISSEIWDMVQQALAKAKEPV